jgi:hypothetical protein
VFTVVAKATVVRTLTEVTIEAKATPVRSSTEVTIVTSNTC